MMPRWALLWAAMAVVLLSAGCSSQGRLAKAALLEKSEGRPVELTGTPFHAQTTDQCGPAALATVLEAAGIETDPETIAAQVYIPARHGSLQIELLAATRNYGLLPYPVEPDLVTLLGEIQSGHPVLVLQNLGIGMLPIWHYAVVVGYLPQSNQFVLRSGKYRRHLVPALKFFRTWRRADTWGVVVLTPGESLAGRNEETVVAAVANLEAVGQTVAAAAAYQAAVREWPGYATAWLGLGNANYALGRLPLAEQAYQRVRVLDAGNVIALNNLALVQADLGRVVEALETIKTALSEAEASDALRGLVLQTRTEIRHRRPDAGI